MSSLDVHLFKLSGFELKHVKVFCRINENHANAMCNIVDDIDIIYVTSIVMPIGSINIIQEK